MKRFLYLLALSGILIGCHNDDAPRAHVPPPAVPPPPTGVTFEKLVRDAYMNTDSQPLDVNSVELTDNGENATFDDLLVPDAN